MVFESIVVELINRYLGSYIEALNSSQLKIGNAQLDNLDIKANAFDDLDLPVKVLQGHINDSKADSFGEKLAAQVIKNLQISIKDIHIRYEDSFSIPNRTFSLGLTLSELTFQFVKLTSLGVYWNPMSTKFAEKAKVPLRSSQCLHIKWQFAYNAVLEESVRRRRLMWSWEHISKHRKISREYIAIWRKKLYGDKLSQAQLANLEAYEEFLDVFNIVLCRQQAELQFNASKQKQDQKANSKSGGWFSWFSRGSAVGSDDVESSSEGDLMKRLETEMTSEEKAHLFAVIDYSESAASGVSGSAINFPISYVSSSIAVTLRQLSLVLLDDKLSVSLRLDSLEALGAQPTLKESCLAKSSIKPVLITSHVNQLLSNGNNQAGTTSKPSHLLCIDFEKNPLDRKADQCISIQADALQIVYDAETINRIVHFFTPPKDVYLQELSNTVLSSFEEVKEVTTSGLKHLTTNRSYTDVHIDIKPSYFILPDSGIYRSDCRLLLVDLGSFTVNSSRTSVPPVCKTVRDQASSNDKNKNDSTGKTDAKESISKISGQLKHKSGKLTFDELKDEAYDKFNINLSSVQVIMVNEGDDWRVLRKMNKSSNHILKPLALSCTLKRCLLRNDVNLPRVIVDGCLPVFSVDFTDAVLKSLYELIVNVPFPEADKSLTTPANPDELLKDVVVLPNSIMPGSVLATRDLLRVTRQLSRNDSDSTLSSWASDTADDDLREESEHVRISQQSKLENYTSNVNDDLHGSQLMDKNKSKVSCQRDQSNLRRKRAKLIDLKLDFVIRKIEIQVLERQLNSQDKNIEDRLILSFNIHEVGTSLIKRRWTQEIQAHIGTLSVAIPQFTYRETNEPVYLARTQRHEETGHHLLAVQLIIAEKNAPDFDTYYQNTRHRLQCDFKVLDVYVHQEATLLLMNYFNNLRISLSKQLKEIEHSSEIEWASSIGDTEGLKKAKLRERLENEMEQQLPGRLTAADAVGSHIARKTERRNIRLEAASLAQKTGKIAVIRELNITQWMVNATLDKVNVTLGSKETDLFSTTVNGLRIDVRTTYNTIEISAILSEFILIDRIVNTSYRKILWVDPTENVVSLQITHFQDNTQSVENSIDPDKVDLAISLQIGKLHSIFLYHFITRVLNFMEAYQEAAEMMLNKFQALSDAAVQQVHEAVDNSFQTRLSLNIVAQAPVIYMPQHSLSNESLMIDFGRITLSNYFEFLNPSKVLPDTTIPVPDPGIMLEHMVVKLENLRLSRVVLKESSVQAEKHVLLPINVELKTRRNLNPNIYSAIPILLVNGGLNEINISFSQGDYRILQEVLFDNFNDLPSSTKVSVKTTPGSTDSSAKSTNKKNKTQQKVEEKNTAQNDNPVKIAVSFDLGMKSVILNLYTCDQPIAEWHNDFPEDKRLATFNLKQFNVSGQMASDSSSQFIAKLNDIKLQDSRPGSDRQITKGQILRVLDHSTTKDNRHNELIYIEFKQDALLNKKIQISLRSIHLCASMDYLMSLLDFQMKSTPTLKSESNNLTSLSDKSKQKRLNNSSITKTDAKKTELLPTAYPFNLELKIQIDNPELVLVEDIYNVDSNAIKLTTELSFDYNMQQDMVIINALISGLSVAACPYNETVGGPFSKEILSPCALSFYASQPINGSLHGTLHMDTLTININPNTIRLLSAISSSVQSSLTTDKNPNICETVSKVESMKGISLDHSDEKSLTEFWKPIQLNELNMPYLGLTSDANDKIECVEHACDVAKVVGEMENRRIDIINIRLKTIRIILESQLDTKSMPMLVLDSTVDAVLTKPITNLELKFLIELSLSYYNDSLNQWEPLIETLPEEGDRMWSLQLEIVSIDNKAECLTDDDWENVGCLQESRNTMLILSRDNLEITISKTALNMLSNLGRSFEAAYKLKNIKSKYDDSTNQVIAPYRIVNNTGCQLVLRYNSQALSLTHFNNDNTMTTGESLHQTPSRSNKAVVSNTEHDIVTYQNSILLNSQQEIGFTELSKTDKNQSIVSSYKDSRHHIWISLSDTSHKPGSFISNSEVVFQLYRGDSELLCLSKDPSNEKPTSSDRRSTIYPIIADVEACLGVKSITFRSTVQVLNNTSERVCLYSPLIKSSVANQLPGLLTVIDPGQSYPLPVEIVNSRQQTGIFIGPEYEKPVISVTPAYWPEFACGVEKYTPSNTDTHLPFLAPYAQTVSSTNIEYKISTSSQFKWPNQLIECHTNSNSMNNNGIVYFYNVAVVNHSDQDNRLDNNNNDNDNTDNTDQQRKTSLTEVADELRATQKKMIQGDKLSVTHCDFQMIIQTAVVLYNQLPFPINFILTDITDTISAGSHYALKTAPPNSAQIEISFEYTGSMYRGKLELHPQMEEYCVIEFESRKEYKVFNLPLGLHRTSNLGQICLTLYAPYWMINKTEKDLTYKSVDDIETVHPATFTGALLYSSLSKSFFGKRKIQRNHSFSSFCSDEDDENEQLLASSHQVIQPNMSISNNNNYDVVNHGTEEITTLDHSVPTATTSFNRKTKSKHSKNNSSSSRKWWHLSRCCRNSCNSSCCCRSMSRKRKTHTSTTRGAGDGRALKFDSKIQVSVNILMTTDYIANLRVCESNWSDKFSLDTVGSSGRVHCTTKSKMSYEIGVKIDLSSSGLTKIVTFMPYFIIINKANINIECCEVDETDTKSTQSTNTEWIKVPAGEAVPFWPHAANSKNMLLKCRVAENIVTAAFPFYESHSILMKLDEKYPGIFVEVETTEETTVITLQMYQEGMALVRLVNNLNDSQPVFYHQSGLQHTVHRLDAGMSIMYAWDCPQAKRELIFYCNETDNRHSNKLTYDSIEEFKVNNTKAYLVSFMWNMQRVLLFTQNASVAKNARLSSDLEPIDQEIVISLQSIGISLVDNHSRAELAYVSITSSGVRWSQIKRGNRLKPLQLALSENLERAYTNFVNASNDADKVRLSIVKLTDTHQPIEVDFNRMIMLKPDQYGITRAFDPGVFLQYKSSISQMQLHAKLFRLQIDSQRLDSNFPVVLSAFPQPKSVALDSGVKPLFEWSAIIGRTANPGSFRFKYFHVLIQEMQLKLDQGFLYDITNFFASSVTHTSKEEAFKHDYLLITSKLIDSPVVQAHLLDGNRSIFDSFHISPIKIHVSFSLTGSTEGKSSAFPSEVLNLFLQSLGVALTEVQDVVFKLDYFERQACIMTINQMSTEITHHYVGQGVRQMYVLVLGLDVLGNPFGVLRGLAQGVEDLFYEPVKGAILGPEEFAEGVTLGVRSLLGHAVGGAAGAVSRITGTLGKGIAALTLDEDYKRKRREQLARRPETFGAGLAQGGRGLFMGVFHGVTGVVTKPFEGAKKEGVEGFFKGFGKGLVGAVTRPVSGVVDFASSSFEGIRRLADTTQEVSRVRPPRFIRSDGIIRPYDKREADDKDGIFGQYLFHIHSVRGNSALVLTTNNLLIIESMDLLGTFSIDWKTPLENLSEVPVINKSGILINLKERQKKMFTSGHRTKQFDCDLNLAKLMINEIDLAMTKHEHLDSNL
uniref:Vacuolar protein sorting-associated protein 13A n=1 Tax=Schistosoma haematobium TaxID=6185 RepID=A0A094ZKC7_SCHHA